MGRNLTCFIENNADDSFLHSLSTCLSHFSWSSIVTPNRSIHTPLAKLLARQARPSTTQDGSGNRAENYSSISATIQHQLRQKMYQ